MSNTPTRADAAFLGVAWAFPVRLDQDGDVATSAYEADIREAVRIILGKRPRERAIRPDFGEGLHMLVFEPINTTTLTVEADAPAGRLLISVDYRVRATNAFYSLVYPFHLMEGKESP